ncbi:unnamed protein product, partial [Oppiella nova]
SKCYKILSENGNNDQATGNCTTLDARAQVIMIKDQSEQDFLTNILRQYNNMTNRVWAKYSRYTIFRNFDDPSDESCGPASCSMQISISTINFGKWYSEPTRRRGLIACDRPQEWTPILLSTALENVTQLLNSQQNTIDKQQEMLEKLSDNTVPIGFIYIQLPNQSKPINLWPLTNWSDVTQEYSGLFFRVEGGDSLPNWDDFNDNDRCCRQEYESCERPQEWTNTILSTALENVTQLVNSQQDTVPQTVPIGFIYMQLPNQSEPRHLWPQTNWTDVTSKYPGLLYRAESGDSLPFGQIQQANYSRIANLETVNLNTNSTDGVKSMELVEGNLYEALGNCSELDIGADVILIGDQDEQKFVERMFTPYTNISNRVWARYPRKSTFRNWEETPEARVCQPYPRKCPSTYPMHISISSVNYGIWYDEPGKRRALIACERPQEWTTLLLSTALENVTQLLNSQQNTIDKQQEMLEKLNTVPIGFIYIQLPYQSEPKHLWPAANWSDVSKEYSGLIFKVEGGDAPANMSEIDLADETSDDSTDSPVQMMGMGSNSYEYLGLGHNKPVKTPQIIPQLCHKHIQQFINGEDFVLAINDSNHVQHSLALTTDGQVFGWGRNSEGQLEALDYHTRPVRPNNFGLRP